MAPEVVLDGTYAPPVDVWSFGCMLAHMASGKPPYSALGLRTVDAVLRAVASGDTPPTALVPPTTPPELRALAERCVRRAPAERPTFDAVADVLMADELIATVMALSERDHGGDPRPLGRLRGGVPSQAAVKWDGVRSSFRERSKTTPWLSSGTQEGGGGSEGGRGPQTPAFDPLGTIGNTWGSFAEWAFSSRASPAPDDATGARPPAANQPSASASATTASSAESDYTAAPSSRSYALPGDATVESRAPLPPKPALRPQQQLATAKEDSVGEAGIHI
jgi:serine/threonine protein kinase